MAGWTHRPSALAVAGGESRVELALGARLGGVAAMKARTALVACVTLLGASAARAGDGVDITYAGGLLTIRCAEARLVDVLEQIGSATGTALVLDAAVKSTLVTANIEAEPVQTALEHLLEGRGVTYAMSLSADGQRVAQMYVG